ncbi:hypothetical protein QE320_gp005 [Pseudomonas phage EM]|uniref:Uncharacterized protein n=1 Tax=Pseudomonas phage EM TaxID=2936914 RepID=A0AAE9KSQ0_9CAUD|nr:hypothetical protein QE320_gp005 [Pseudomonas phage EM]UPW35807.1 hypothetical protein EM_005 [Pseudomonas phage EM]
MAVKIMWAGMSCPGLWSLNYGSISELLNHEPTGAS